jgi:tetratricopeptide (TPR) repeat protein
MALHNQIREIETRPKRALSRRKYLTLRVCDAWLDHAETKGTSDVTRALRCARISLTFTRRLGQRCRRVRAVALYGGANRMRGDLARGELCFLYGFQLAKGCGCCVPALNRKFSFVLSELSQHENAIGRARLSREMYEDKSDAEGIGKALFSSGVALMHAGRITEALSDLQESFNLLPADVVDHRKAARQFYVLSLSRSPEPDHLRRAATMVPEIRASYKGIRGESLELAKIDWMDGQIAAGLAMLETGWNRHIQRCKARQFLTGSLEYFEKKKMFLEALAVQADLAALEAIESREKAARLFERTAGCPEALLPLLKKMVQATRRDPVEKMWAAIREFRAATVALGADPPLVAYGVAA